MTHKHHILPKYKGGTNEQENLVEVTVTQHAMFHYCNWMLWGEKEDWLAWRGLAGEIGKEEIVHEMRIKGAQSGLITMHRRLKDLRLTDAAFAKRERENIQRHQPKGVEAAKSEPSRNKRKETFKQNNHSKGERNSQYGTMWITNGELNKKIRKDDLLPEGYYPGRKLK